MKKDWWIACSERMPEFPENRDSLECIVFTEYGSVMAMSWRRNAYAKTQKGREPRWERNFAIARCKVTHWMPMPPAPEQSA